ncbi:hypothetical protein PIB30_114424, partial [Stylosanthes scabra]|nr:hypothetical protein [Stylosanthes scabra]
DLSATTTRGYILGFGGRQGYAHETKEFPKRWQVPLVLFLSNLQPAKSESEYPIRSQADPFGYHNPTFKVPMRYFIILFTALK